MSITANQLLVEALDAQIFQNCFSGTITTECDGQTVAMTETGFTKFSDELVDSIFFYYTLLFQATGESFLTLASTTE